MRFRKYATTAILYTLLTAAAVLAALPYTYVGGPAPLGQSSASYNPVVTAGLDANALVRQSQTTQRLGILASAARTTTQTGSTLNNYTLRGVLLILNVTAASGTGGLTVSLQLNDLSSAATPTLFSATSAVTAIGTYTYWIYPGVGSTVGTQSLSAPLSGSFFAKVTAGDSSSYTYSLSLEMLN